MTSSFEAPGSTRELDGSRLHRGRHLLRRESNGIEVLRPVSESAVLVEVGAGHFGVAGFGVALEPIQKESVPANGEFMMGQFSQRPEVAQYKLEFV